MSEGVETTRPAIPGEVAAQRAALRLTLAPSFTARRWRRYVDSGGTLEEAAQGRPAVLERRLGTGRREARRIAQELRRSDPDTELADARRAGVRVIPWDGEAYPAALRALTDPPPAIYLRGSLEPDDAVAVAVVGARRATPYGLRVARALAADLARSGVTVVAGLARGIDAAAHSGALEAGGRRIAVLGSGLLDPYPPEHLDLLERIVGAGGVVSEHSLSDPPRPHHFPRRNRILAALSLAVVVVEAAERSGALSTARHALDLGREVLAVPGPVDEPASRGTLRMLQEGAAAVGSAEDLFHALGWCAGGPPKLPEEEQRILEALGEGAASTSRVAQTTGMREEVVAGYLLTLEVRGLVVRAADGGYWAR